MEANIQRIRIMIKHILRTITVMYIGIYYGNAFDSIGLTYVLNHNGFNINRTEATNTMNHSHRMVTWWSYQCKGAIYFTAHEPALLYPNQLLLDYIL